MRVKGCEEGSFFEPLPEEASSLGEPRSDATGRGRLAGYLHLETGYEHARAS